MIDALRLGNGNWDKGMKAVDQLCSKGAFMEFSVRHTEKGVKASAPMRLLPGNPPGLSELAISLDSRSRRRRDAETTKTSEEARQEQGKGSVTAARRDHGVSELQQSALMDELSQILDIKSKLA